MTILGISIDDWVQYGLIAGLLWAAMADRAAHRTYTSEMTRQHKEILKGLSRILAAVMHTEAKP